jgi:hypothetical protein
MTALTDEQQAAVDKAKANSVEGQTLHFREALKSALNTANLEILANDGKPSIDSVIRALVSLQAEFIAMQPIRSVRRLQIKDATHNLQRLISLRVGAEG